MTSAPSVDDIREYLPLVHRVVNRLKARLPPNVSRDDLVAAGTIGLIDALGKNGQERGPAFEWYARVRVRGAIFDELRREDWLSRRARARATRDGSGTIISLEDAPVMADSARIPVEHTMDLARAVESLPDREKTIVTRHYFKDEPFGIIAKALGVSEPRVCQLHARAVAKLRHTLSEQGHEAA